MVKVCSQSTEVPGNGRYAYRAHGIGMGALVPDYESTTNGLIR